MRIFRPAALAFVLLPHLLACSSSSEAGPAAAADTSPAIDSAAATDTSTSDSPAVDSTTPADSATTDSATTDSPASDAGCTTPDGGSTCNTVVDDGTAIKVIDVPADPPVMTGGTIVDGTYVATKWERYTGVGGTSGPTADVTEILTINGCVIQESRVYDKIEGRFTQIYAIDATDKTLMHATIACDTTKTFTGAYDLRYTATATTFTMSTGASKKTRVVTFTKR